MRDVKTIREAESELRELGYFDLPEALRAIAERMEKVEHEMTKDEKSMILYAETCVVDHSGLLEGQRMNKADMDALNKFKEAGWLDFGRIPSSALSSVGSKTHWVTFNEKAWCVAHQLRRSRSLQIGKWRQIVDASIAARSKP